MADSVKLHLLPAEQGWFPREVSLSELERLAQDDFATRDMTVVPEFFEKGHPLSPHNLTFLLIGKNPNSELASSSIVENDSVDGFNFLYVTKANVALSYYGNGLLNHMVEDIARIAEERGIPVVLRTSDVRVSRKYAKPHDIFTRIGGYYIHGFGFQQKSTRIEIFQGARELFANKIAPYVALKTPTVVPKDRQAVIADAYIPRKIDEPQKRARYLETHPFAKTALGLYPGQRENLLEIGNPISMAAHPILMARYLYFFCFPKRFGNHNIY